MTKIPFWKQYFIAVIRLKALPYGFVIILGILGYTASQLWDENVIAISKPQYKSIENIEDLKKNATPSLVNDATNCTYFFDTTSYHKDSIRYLVSLLYEKPLDTLHLHSFTFENQSLNQEICKRFRMTFGTYTSAHMVYDRIIPLTYGSEKPEFKRIPCDTLETNPCLRDVCFEIQNLMPGIPVTLSILSTESTLPFYYSDFLDSDFRLVKTSSVRDTLFFVKGNGVYLIPLILGVLIIYFLLFAYVQVKYPESK